MQLQINTHSFITLVTGFLLTSTVVLAHPKPLVSNPTCLTNSNHQVELCAVDLVGACAKLFSEGTAPPECPTRSTSIKKRNQYAPVCHVNSHTDSGTTTVVVTSTTVTVIEVTTTTSTTELTSEEETTTSTTTTTTSEEPSTTSTTPTTTEEPTTTTTTTEEPTTTTTTTTEVPPLTTATPEPSCIADGQPCADIFRPDLCCGMACTIGGLPTPLCFSF